ncbi:hypothetical protein GOODEAATRI_011702 [Goodea atripinnis]|uniref:Secreted protein n=1 Tax=Goodea atripinnis TaxID=208336 RepID=A0ABV0N0J7_9TELE
MICIHLCLKFPQSLEWALLHNLLKAVVIPAACALFQPHFFLPLNLTSKCLDTVLCEQPSSLPITYLDAPLYGPSRGCSAPPTASSSSCCVGGRRRQTYWDDHLC